MSEWKKVRLGEVCSKIGSGATPSGGKNAYCEDGISLIRSQNVLDFSFSTNGLAFINEEQARKLDGVTVAPKDVLLNITTMQHDFNGKRKDSVLGGFSARNASFAR